MRQQQFELDREHGRPDPDDVLERIERPRHRSLDQHGKGRGWYVPHRCLWASALPVGC
jgi:hypothetical protein